MDNRTLTAIIVLTIIVLLLIFGLLLGPGGSLSLSSTRQTANDQGSYASDSASQGASYGLGKRTSVQATPVNKCKGNANKPKPKPNKNKNNNNKNKVCIPPEPIGEDRDIQMFSMPSQCELKKNKTKPNNKY